MPLLQLLTHDPVPSEKRGPLLKDLSEILAAAIGKPELYVMVTLADGGICMGGEVGAAAFADVRSIGGLGGEVNRSISEKVCALLADQLDIPAERVYLNFTDVERHAWGYNGGTFG